MLYCENMTTMLAVSDESTYLLLILMLFHLPLAVHKRTCASFQFPSLFDNTITVEERTSLNISFWLKYDTCEHFQDSLVQISIYNKQNGKYYPKCNIQGNNETFRQIANNTMSCFCNFPLGQCGFMKVVDRSDNSNWRWSILNGLAEEVVLIFNVTYPASVLHLNADDWNMLPSYTVLRNKTVKISCAWENGNPLTKVRLLDGYGTILNMSEVNNITYIFPSASCDNSGIIRCEAPGSNRNASFTFLVQCPPIFANTSIVVYSAMYGQSVDLHFGIRMHSLDIKDCHLSPISEQQDSHVDEITIRCYSQTLPHTLNGTIYLEKNAKRKCLCSVYGQAPDLTLTVRYNHVTENDGRKWRLTVTNSEGSGHVDYIVRVILGRPTFGNAPIVNFTVLSGIEADLVLPFRSHTSYITNCQLSKYHYTIFTCKLTHSESANSSTPETHHERCQCSINGTAPAMNLTIRLYDVTLQDGGRWYATVENVAGAGSVDIFLIVTGATILAENMLWHTIVATAIPTTLVLIGLCSAIIVFCYAQQSRKCYAWNRKSENSSGTSNYDMPSGEPSSKKTLVTVCCHKRNSMLVGIKMQREIGINPQITSKVQSSESVKYLTPSLYHDSAIDIAKKGGNQSGRKCAVLAEANFSTSNRQSWDDGFRHNEIKADVIEKLTNTEIPPAYDTTALPRACRPRRSSETNQVVMETSVCSVQYLTAAENESSNDCLSNFHYEMID